MLRRFKVTINEKVYDVEMEELGAMGQSAETTFPVETAGTQPIVPQPAAPHQQAPASGADEAITAPMPGNIIDVKVKPGDSVSENQVLLILEAMKMENEIVAPKSGTVSVIHVNKGDVIDVGQPMITIA